MPSAMASDSHSFMSLVTNRIAHTIGTKAKFWPTDRSNSPDIISIVTPIETMPTVAAMLLIAVIVCGDQKFAVCTREEKRDRDEAERRGQLRHPKQCGALVSGCHGSVRPFETDWREEMSGGSHADAGRLVKGRHVRARS